MGGSSLYAVFHSPSPGHFSEAFLKDNILNQYVPNSKLNILASLTTHKLL